MPTASRQVRKNRRIKRERTIAFRMLDMALAQRDYARTSAFLLNQELKKRDEAAQAEAKPEGGLEIIKVDEDPKEPTIE